MSADRRKSEPSAADCFSHDGIYIVYLKRSAYLDTERARKTHVVRRGKKKKGEITKKEKVAT